jgi:hypothetical protein
MKSIYLAEDMDKWTEGQNSGFRKFRGISWLVEDLLISQRGFRSLALIISPYTFSRHMPFS